MPKQRQVKIDRAVYAADDSAKTYRFLKRNPSWKRPSHGENEKNKKSIDGYSRVFRSGESRVFRYDA